MRRFGVSFVGSLNKLLSNQSKMIEDNVTLMWHQGFVLYEVEEVPPWFSYLFSLQFHALLFHRLRVS